MVDHNSRATEAGQQKGGQASSIPECFGEVATKPSQCVEPREKDWSHFQSFLVAA